MNRNLYFLFIGRALAVIGLQAQNVAIGWQVYQMTKRPLDLGLIGLAQFLPMILLSLIAGQAADRFDRRKIVLGCLVVFAVVASLFSFLSKSGALTVSTIYGLLIIVGITRSFIGPAVQSYFPSLVAPEYFARAMAWNSSNWQLATVIGPSVGGMIYSFSKSAHLVYALCAITMLLSFISVACIDVRTGRSDHAPITWKTFFAGIHYVWNKKILLGAMSLDLFAVLLGGAVALLPAYASDILKVGPAGLGFLRSAPGLGAACMGIFLALHPIESRAGRKLLFCIAGFGTLTIVFGLSTHFALSLTALFFMGALDLVSVVVRGALVQLTTPTNMRGRVSAVNIVFIGASNELGEFESGITAAWFGVVPAVVIGGLGTLLVTGLWSILFPELRNLEQIRSDSG